MSDPSDFPHRHERVQCATCTYILRQCRCAEAATRTIRRGEQCPRCIIEGRKVEVGDAIAAQMHDPLSRLLEAVDAILKGSRAAMLPAFEGNEERHVRYPTNEVEQRVGHEKQSTVRLAPASLWNILGRARDAMPRNAVFAAESDAAKEIARLTQQCDDGLRANAGLVESCAELRKEIAKLEDKARWLREQNTGLQQALGSTRQEAEVANAERDAVYEEIGSLKRAWEESVKVGDASREQAAVLHNEVLQLKNERDGARDQVSAITRMRDHAERSEAEAMKRIELLEANIAAARANLGGAS